MPTKAPTFRWRKTSEPQRKREFDRRRGSSTARGYDHRWRKAARAYLDAHPLCVHHERRGQIVAATEVDHIIPHRGQDDPLFWDEGNWQGLCKGCHSFKTATFDSKFLKRGGG